MRSSSRLYLGRLITLSFQNLGRNLFLSLATTLMMGLILFIFNVVMILNGLARSSIEQVEEQVDLIVYLESNLSTQTINDLIQEVESIPIVTQVEYTSEEQALQEFLEHNPDKVDIFAEYNFENTLPASLKIVTEQPDQHDMIMEYLNDSEFASYLEPVKSSEENASIAQRLSDVIHFTEKLIIGVLLTFIVGSSLMILNAIHLSIFTRQKEIQIMQLVGARPAMIYIPFLVEGLLYSFIAVIFSTGLTVLFLSAINLFAFAKAGTSLEPWQLLLLELGASIGIGILASLFAIRYYLRRKMVFNEI